MPKQRDYKREYRQRMERAAARGLTRSQARGHARPGEAPIRPRQVSERDRDTLEDALKALRQTGNLSDAARSVGISTERFRWFLRENSLAERRGRTWAITDDRPREMLVISQGVAKRRVFRGHDQASLNGQYLAAVRLFLAVPQIELLMPFQGLSVIDAKGKSHPFETNPNTLYRLAAAGSEVFQDIYRLIQ